MQREAVGRVMGRHGLSQRHACSLVGLDCSTLRYQRKRTDDATVRHDFTSWPRSGVVRVSTVGLGVGARRSRDESQEALSALPRRAADGTPAPRGKRALGTRAPMTLPNAINQRWSLDFVSDALSDGRRFRILCIVMT